MFSASTAGGPASPPYRYLAVDEVPDADVDRARAVLAEAALGREHDLRQGREPALPHTSAMHPERVACGFTSLSHG